MRLKHFLSVFLTLLTLSVGQMWGVSYTKCTATSDLVAGSKYYISSASSYNANGVVMGKSTGGNNYPQTTFNGTPVALTLGGNATNGWTFAYLDGSTTYYLDPTSTTSNNHLKRNTSVTDYGKFTISFSSGKAEITSKGKSSRNIIRYNSSSSCFACYSSGGQADVYLYRETYSITYNCDGAGSGCPNTASAQASLPNPLPAAPVKDGYDFDGWYTNSGKTTAAVAGATLTGDVTLYAKWVESVSCSNEVDVHKGAETNGTYTLSEESVCADGDGGTIFVTGVSGTGCYEFDEIEATVGNPDNTNMKVTGITAETTITVKFKKKTVNTYIDEVQDNGEQESCGTTAPTLTDKTRNTTGTCVQQHYHFVGWVSEANKANPTAQNIVAGGSTVAVNGTTYYAVWAKETTVGSEESDVINNSATSSNLGSTGTTSWGTDFTLTGSTGAKYYIHSMGTSGTTNALQWNSNGYLYCSQKPTSGAKLKSVSITTTANKNIGVYGSASVYSAAPSSTSLGNLAATSSGATYNFTTDYYCIGLKGTASSTSITSITITYGTAAVYGDYITVCCEPLGQINGSVNVSDITKNSATVSFGKLANAAGYEYSFNGTDWTNTGISGAALANATQTFSLSGLTNAHQYHLYLRGIGDGVNNCDAPGETRDADTFTTLGVVTAAATNGTAYVSLTSGSGWASSVDAALSTTIYLKAEPADNYDFNEWTATTGTLASANSAETTLNGWTANTTVTASFTPKQKIKLGTPVPVEMAEGDVTAISATIKWNEVANASSYKYKLGSGEWTSASVTTNNGVCSCVLTGLTAGTPYTWQVKAIGDNTNYEDGDACTVQNFTTVAKKPTLVEITTAPSKTVYEVGETFDASEMVVKVTYNNGDIDPAYTGYTITPSGALTKSDEHVTITATLNGGSASFNQSITVKNRYTISWYVNGDAYTPHQVENDGKVNGSTSILEGDAITLPTAPADNTLGCANKFMGWSTHDYKSVKKAASDYDDLFTTAAGAPEIEAATDFYAVFATSTTEPEVEHKISFSRSGTTDTYTTGYEFSASATSKNDGYYQDGTGTTGLKLYHTSNAFFTSAPSSVTLTASIGAGNNNTSFSNYVYAQLLDKDGNGIGNAIQVTNSITNKTGDTYTPTMNLTGITSAYGVQLYHVKESDKNIRYFSFSLSYTTGGTTVSNYVTECPAVVAPTFSPAAGEYHEAKNVEISCATEGYDAIRYTINGEDPTKTTGTVYSDAITVDETMTIKAIAVKGDNVSDVVSATYTITYPRKVTFDAGAGTLSIAPATSITEEAYGEGITLPSATPSSYCVAEGWTFAGWATANNTTTAPTLKAGDPYDCTEATLYAVYKKVEETYTNNYSKITSIDDLESGEDYVIAANYSNKDYALTAEEVSGYTYYMQRTEVTVADDAITSPAANLIWSITKNASDKVYLKNSDNYLYITYTGSYTNLKLASSIDNTDEEWFTPAFNALNGALTLTSQKYSTYQMIHVDGAHPEYKAATTGAQGNLYIYKHQHDVTYNSNPVCCDIEAVTNLNAAVKSATSVTLSWTTPASIANITEYKVLDANDDVLKEGIDKEATSVDVTGLTECQTYTLRVVSYSDVCNVASSSVETTPSASTKTVTFDYNGGTGSVSSVSTVCGVATVALPTPNEREGYNFKGWNDGTTTYAPSTETYTPEANITLTAQWAQLFTVSYELAGGTTTTEIASATYEAGATVTLTDQVPNKGVMASFKAWSFSTEVTMTDETHFTMPSSDVTITATYNGVGAGKWILVDDADEVTAGSYIIIAAADYNYAISTTQNNNNRGQQSITKNNEYLTYSETAPAIFRVEDGEEINEKATFAFYDGTGYIYAASGSANHLKTQTTNNANGMWTVAVNESGEATIIAQGTNTRNVLRYNNGSSIFSCYGSSSSESAISLYKFYENVPTVTYYSNTGEDELEGFPKEKRTVKNELTDKYEATVIAGPSRYMFEFAGWYDNEDGTGDAYTGTIEVDGDNLDLYAKWDAAPVHHITYNTSGSTGATPTDAADYYEGDVVTLASGNGLSNAGYFFDGWNVTYVDGESAVQTLTVDEGKFTMPDYNVTATAKWAPKSDDKWLLVTGAGMLEVDGEYAIVGATAKDGKYYAMSKTQNNNNRGVAEVEFDGDNLVGSSSMAIFTLEAGTVDDTWAFYDPANTGYIYAASSNSNHLKTQAENDANGSWEIDFTSGTTITAQGSNSRNILKYNSGSDIFSCYGSGQKEVKLYKKKAVVRVEDDMSISTVAAGSDVIIESGATLTVNSAKEINDLTVKAGGEVVLSTNALTVVGTFTIKSEMASGNSGQMKGATSTNFATTGEAYIDITLGAGGTNQQWHAFTVPFPVDVMNGIYDLDGNKLTNEVNYAIMEYHGDERAKGNYGWKKIRTTLVPGTFYIMATDGYRTTYRFKKKAGAALVAENSKHIFAYPLDGGTEADKDNGWNGLGNPNLFYGKVNLAVQVLDPESYTYVTKTANSTNFVVGTPFFYQAAAAGTMVMETADASANYAPARVQANEIKDIPVSFGNEDFTDYLYVSANEDALNTYETGKDLVKMTMTNTPSVAQIFGKAYNSKLSMVYTPLVNNQAEVALELYAPANGQYTISAPSMDNADLYLTYEGSIIWNLSMGEYEIELAKGTTNDYGLLLQAKAPQVVTGVDEVDAETGVQKIIIDEHVFILRGGQMYDVTGKMVK